MVDLISSRTIDVTKLAMDGLMMRQKAITANTANVMSPDYNRKEVNFEGQLRDIVSKDELKEMMKAQNSQNSLKYNPTSLDFAVNVVDDQRTHQLTPQEKDYLASDIYKDYSPQVTDDRDSTTSKDGNNVDLEHEIMDMAKVGTRYNVLANLEQRSMKNTADVIKGGA